MQNRILYLSLLPSLLITLIFGSYFTYRHYTLVHHQLTERAGTLATNLATSYADSVKHEQLSQLQQLVTLALEERDVRAAAVLSQDTTKRLVHSGPKMINTRQINHELHDDQLFLLKTGRSVRARAPIFNAPLPPHEVIAWVEIELSSNNTNLAFYQFLLVSLGLIIVVLSFIAVIIFRITRNTMVPIAQILETIKDLEHGQLDSRVHVNKKGELGQLAVGINAMASALQRSSLEYQHSLEQATRDLQETLDEMEIRNSELQIGRREALEASIMKSEFLANVSHEIRTPLNGIIGFSELLSRSHINDQQTEFVATIHKSAHDLLKILNDILDLSKIDSGKLVLEKIPFSLRDIMEQVLIMQAPEAANKGIDLNYLVYSDVPTEIVSDPLRLKQVLINLINNAIKFTERGQINIRIASSVPQDNEVTLNFEIQDTGIGISEEQINKIFHAFSQADSSTSRRFGGTGLGLLITKGLIEAMEGTIQVSSQIGRGSVFSFSINVQLNTDQDDDFMPLPGHRAALIDAQLMSRLNTSSLLTQWQLEHDDFETIHHLLNTPAPYPWQVILLALGHKLPSDGQLQHDIQQLANLGIRIIAASSSLKNEHYQAFKGLGVTHMMDHPCTRKNLHQLICQSLQVANVSHCNPKHNMMFCTQVAPTILAVDDNQANLKLLITLLHELNIPTLSASSGQEAIDLVKEQHVDMVFMDIQMPNMTGLEATEKIRLLPERNNLPIVALTAHAIIDEKEALLRAGMSDYQSKPINLNCLLNCIERWTGYRVPTEQRAKTATLPLRIPSFDGVFSVKLALNNTNQNALLALELFEMLIQTLPTDTKAIMDAWEEENYAALLEEVHKLHGACRYSGVPILVDALETLETSLKTNELNEWPNLIRKFVEASASLQHWASHNDWQKMLTDS